MTRWGSIAALALGLTAACVAGPAGAFELDGLVRTLGQVRDGDQSRETEAPMNVYGDARLSGLPLRTDLGTYFRLQRDFGRDDGDTDFYAGYADVGLAEGLHFIGGRQFVGEGPGGVFVADAGRIRFDPGWPVSFTVYGGAPTYFEPTYSSELLSQDEILFGGSMRTRRWNGGQLGVGYMQLERDDHILRQLVTGTWTQSLTSLPGLPSLYGSFAFDADGANVDLGTVGVNFFSVAPGLMLNVEGTYYKPQDQGENPQTDIDRREDAIFELFSVSNLLQFRGGLTYRWSRAVSLFADYSYQNYEATSGENENGHVASAGVDWLPGGDGLEVVRLEYYLADSGGGNANGVRGYYENSFYDHIVFRMQLDVTYYETQDHQDDVPFSSFVGLGYELLPGLIGEINFEANRNQRFDSDFRFGFDVSYNFRHRVPRPRTVAEGT